MQRSYTPGFKQAFLGFSFAKINENGASCLQILHFLQPLLPLTKLKKVLKALETLTVSFRKNITSL